MSLFPQRGENFLEGRSTFSFFHHKQETSSDSSGIERHDTDTLFLILLKLIKRVLQRKKEFIGLLIGKTRKTYILNHFDKSSYQISIHRFFQNTMKSVENFQI